MGELVGVRRGEMEGISTLFRQRVPSTNESPLLYDIQEQIPPSCAVWTSAFLLLPPYRGQQSTQQQSRPLYTGRGQIGVDYYLVLFFRHCQPGREKGKEKGKDTLKGKHGSAAPCLPSPCLLPPL